MKNRKFTAVLTCALLAGILMTGCAEKPLDAGQTAASVGEETISLGLANFAARIQQAQQETYYMPYFGQNMWSQDVGGMTYEEAVKTDVMEMLKEYYIVRSHAADYGVELTGEDQAKIAEVSAKFMADNPEKTLTRMTASEEVMGELLELTTIHSRVYREVIKEADTEVPDEEAAQKRVNYVFVSTLNYTDEDGERAEYTDAEKEERRALAGEILAAARESGDLEAAAEEQELTMSTATYGGEAATALVDEVIEAADALEEGEFAEVVETETGCYIVKLDSAFDEEATETRREEIIQQRQSDYYAEVYETWAEEVDFTVNEDVWAQVTFAGPITIITDPVEEETADEAPAEEEPAEEQPAEETEEETLSEEQSSDETAGEAPSEEQSSDETAGEAPADEASAEDTGEAAEE